MKEEPPIKKGPDGSRKGIGAKCKPAIIAGFVLSFKGLGIKWVRGLSEKDYNRLFTCMDSSYNRNKPGSSYFITGKSTLRDSESQLL